MFGPSDDVVINYFLSTFYKSMLFSILNISLFSQHCALLHLSL